MICDLAETYGIYDYKAIKPTLIATLAVGLPDTSRIKRKSSKVNLTLDQTLLASLIDSVNLLTWMLSRKKRGKRPESVLNILLDRNEKKQELMAFKTADDYEAWRAQKQREWHNG